MRKEKASSTYEVEKSNSNFMATKGLVQEHLEVCLLVNSLGPIADTIHIISTRTS